MFHNRDEFAALYPDDASPQWKFCAPLLERGKRLAAIQKRLLARADACGRAAAQDGPLKGYLDSATGELITGWAALPDHPGVPVVLEVTIDGVVAGTVIANQLRGDLADAGIGDGRHGFAFRPARPLDPFRHHEISVTRRLDGRHLTDSPRVIEAAASVGTQVVSGLQQQIAAAEQRLADATEAAALLQTLLTEAERVRQKHAQLMREAGPTRRRRGSGRIAVRRALVIDAQWPRPDRDAGSQAVLAHMRGLQRLGWHVSFIAQGCVAPDAAVADLLRDAGIACHAPPAVMSVEELLARQAGIYQLVYLHRGAVAAAYTGLVRHYQPGARILYSLADLHHLRVARQAQVEARPELLGHARRLRERELATIRAVDGVITHSAVEAALLAKEDLGRGRLHVVPWAVPVRPTTAAQPAWEARNGLVFVANFTHLPNPDALAWLICEGTAARA